eukprot:scaffold32342_cov42-Phaeocystis_antarctica.AAC.1
MRRRLSPDDGVVGHAGEGAGGGEVEEDAWLGLGSGLGLRVRVKDVEEDARERPPAKAHGDLVRVRVRDYRLLILLLLPRLLLRRPVAGGPGVRSPPVSPSARRRSPCRSASGAPLAPGKG